MVKLGLSEILKRKLPDSGFASRFDEGYRPDATAWAMIILKAYGAGPEIVNAAGCRLESSQIADGRVVFSREHQDTVWLTPLSILAWYGISCHDRALSQASQFLLKTTGLHWEKTAQDLVGHDTLIPGWSWSDGTHSWVSPTAMSMLALTIAGFGGHERVTAGARLLVDRQLPRGGWNYGNTSVLGKELRPFPETTGLALNALVGHVDQNSIEASLNYLLEHVKTFRSPLSLGWSILGLKAWHVVPEKMDEWIIETFERGHVYGGYDTASLSVLLAASLATEGLESVVRHVPEQIYSL